MLYRFVITICHYSTDMYKDFIHLLICIRPCRCLLSNVGGILPPKTFLAFGKTSGYRTDSQKQVSKTWWRFIPSRQALMVHRTGHPSGSFFFLCRKVVVVGKVDFLSSSVSIAFYFLGLSPVRSQFLVILK